LPKQQLKQGKRNEYSPLEIVENVQSGFVELEKWVLPSFYFQAETLFVSLVDSLFNTNFNLLPWLYELNSGSIINELAV